MLFNVGVISTLFLLMISGRSMAYTRYSDVIETAVLVANSAAVEQGMQIRFVELSDSEFIMDTGANVHDPASFAIVASNTALQAMESPADFLLAFCHEQGRVLANRDFALASEEEAVSYSVNICMPQMLQAIPGARLEGTLQTQDFCRSQPQRDFADCTTILTAAQTQAERAWLLGAEGDWPTLSLGEESYGRSSEPHSPNRFELVRNTLARN